MALKKPEPATVITNVLTGRPARAILTRFIAEQGPVNAETPAFPLATQATIPLRTIAEKQGSGDFSSFWVGEARSLGRDMNAEDLTRTIAEESLALLGLLSNRPKKTCSCRAPFRAIQVLVVIPGRGGTKNPWVWEGTDCPVEPGNDKTWMAGSGPAMTGVRDYATARVPVSAGGSATR